MSEQEHNITENNVGVKVIYADLDELVFRNRNKEYGAYLLRKLEPKILRRATLIGVLAFLIAFSAPKIKNLIEANMPKEEVKKKKITYAELGEPPPINKEEEPPPPPPPQKLPEPPKKASVKFVPPKVVEDEKVEEPEETIANVDTLQKVDPGLENVEGDPDAVEDIDFGDVEGTGDAPVEVKEPEKKEEEPNPYEFVLVEKEPAPVNMDDIKQRIGYPPQAKEAGIEGIVTVRVLVDENGNYVKHIVLNSPHPILTKAVEKELPKLKFTPGIQAGKPIKVWVNIPFRFKLM